MNKNLIAILGGLILASILFLGSSLAYDDKTTHPDLTREIISFYELSIGKKLTDEQKRWIISGSIEEDRAPRWINHFYDPVFERGLQTESFGISGYLAKNWAQYSSYQTLSPSNIGNLWTGNGPVISGSWWGDFSYEAAVKNYSKDKEKEAYLALGHILHLIEDMTVPEHTRNDPHPGGDLASRYENWTKNNSSGLTQDLGKRIFNQGYKPIIYANLENYFDNLATYTNTHFFSPRTINSKEYQKPKIIFEDGTFAYGIDERGEYFDLAYIKDKDFITQKIIYSLKDEHDQVMQEYWLRLSRQAVINGAGVISLFLKEAETAKEAELAKQKIEERQTVQKSSFFGSIVNLFKNPGSSNQPALTITSELNPVAPKINQIKPEPTIVNTNINPAVPQTVNPSPVPVPKSVSVPTQTPSPATQNTPNQPNNQTPQQPQGAAPIVYGGGGGGGGGGSSSNPAPAPQINQSTSQQAATSTEGLNVLTFHTGDLVINEIMYDLEGSDTLNGKSREWVELYNNSGRKITLTGGNSGWRFNDGSNHLLNEPAAQGSMVISAGSYVILAGDAATFLSEHSGFRGTVIDTVMSLKNSTSTVKISAPDGAIVDEVTYYSSWGANGNGKTLERKLASGGSNDAANWAQSSAPGGTPGAVNNFEVAAATSMPGTATSTLTTATSTPVVSFGTDVSATTTISTNTTWTLAGSPYRLFFDGTKRPTVMPNAVLTIEPGVKIIPQGGNYTAMEIQGTLNAIAVPSAPIIFTSINDANGNASITPQKGEWLNVVFSQGAQANLDYVEFRYGGQRTSLSFHEMVNVVGARVSINHSKFGNSQSVALHLVDSSGRVENSIFSDNNCGISADSSNSVANAAYGGCYGVHTSGQILSSIALEIKNNQFIRNQLVGIETRSGAAPIIDNNIFIDNGYPVKIESSYPIVTNSQINNSTTSPNILKGIAISGYTHFSHDFTLKNNPQLPYILETNGPNLSPYVDSGVTLTIEPGTIFKTNNVNSTLFVYGILIASTTPDNPIVFTSLKDDARSGDTNGDGAASSPQNNDWANIKFLSGSVGNFTNTIFNYGGYGFVPYNLPPINSLVKDFPAITTASSTGPSATSSQWLASRSYNFNKIIIHKFSTVNPKNFNYKVGIKDSQNNFIASVDLLNMQNINESELTIAVQGQFLTGGTYYAAIETDDSFSVGRDADGKLATAFYELVPGLPANPAISIDSGATVVVQ